MVSDPRRPVYLDYNATTPVDPAVAGSMLPYLSTIFGNPSSGHVYGAEARAAVEYARLRVSSMLGCDPEEVVFTSGGSESNNHAILGVLGVTSRHRPDVVTSAIEHPSVLETCLVAEERGGTRTVLPVDGRGLVDPGDLEEAIGPETALVSVMHANNEIGTIQDIPALAGIARSAGVPLHCDCAQSVGKIPVSVRDLGVDLLTIAGHKVYAPKGTGVLYVRGGTRLGRLVRGADHEGGRRAGTENVAGIIALGQACSIVENDLSSDARHMHEMRDRLESKLLDRFPDARVHGHPERRLPNTSSIGFPGLDASLLVARISGVALSAGAACHAGSATVSGVLEAIGAQPELARGTIRLSVGRFTTRLEIDAAFEELASTIDALRGM